jgi:hypothetical protein
MASKTDRTVVRDTGRQAKSFESCERHNERENETYHNADVVLDRSNLNVHFFRNLSPAGTPETYEQTFNRMLDDGTIVKRGLKSDARIFSELVFDVNTDYFEQHGGYEYAKKFYEEAYRCAVKEIGGEQYILSAVLHADERNKALSEQLGRDVYHYHLHVAYVPMVEKEVLWTKRCKDPALVGTVKEVIPQISHSKKWPIRVPVERDGKTIILNSYSLLQDRYFEHMRAAGFDGFERGERGSTTEHLDVLDYKIQQDNKRLDVLDERMEQEQQRLDSLSASAEKKEKRIEKLDKKLEDDNFAFASIKEINSVGKKNLVGQIVLTESELDYVQGFAREGVKSRPKIKELQQQLADTRRDRDAWKSKYEKLWEQVKDIVAALKRAPRRLWATIRDILAGPAEEKEPEKMPERTVTQTKKKSHGLEL